MSKKAVKLIDPTTVLFDDDTVRVVSKVDDLGLGGGSEELPFDICSCFIEDDEDDEQIDPYVNHIYFDKLNYELAKSHFEENPYVPVGGCTSVLFGGPNLVVRNYDWTYDNTLQWVVSTPGTIGIALHPETRLGQFSCSSELSLYKEIAELVPFYLLDGMNHDGLYCSMNVVPISDSLPFSEKTTPSIEKRDRICSMMLCRYIIDNFSTAQEAFDYVRDYVEVFPSQSLIDIGYNLHFHIADKSSTSIVMEFINDTVVSVASHISTNFNLNGVALGNELPTIQTHTDGGDAPSSIGIQLNGQGIERYNMCFNAEHYGLVTDITTAFNLAEALYYTGLYRNESNIWYSELTDGDTLTVDSLSDDFSTALSTARGYYSSRHRSSDIPTTWETKHAAVYDLSSSDMYVRFLENQKNYTLSCSV